MFQQIWHMITKKTKQEPVTQHTEEDFENELDEYLKPRHYLMGVDVAQKIEEEVPEIKYTAGEIKLKKKVEVIEITYGRNKQKSGKLF